jgi:DNA repair protein RadC
MEEHKYSIKSWAKNDRPREKLRMLGAENLSDSELLSILIQNGTKNRTAVDIARDILSLGKNNLLSLGKLSVREMMKVRGVGEAKALIIAAALELGRRRESAAALDQPVVQGSKDVANYFQAMLKDLRHEVFAVMYLNRANRINHLEIVSEGGMTATIADPRIILKKALEENAASMILCHNHPSGSLRPSRADEELTTKIKEASKYFDIRILDHIIVSEAGYFSFADEGIM